MNQAMAYRKEDKPRPWVNCWTAMEDMFAMSTGRLPYPTEVVTFLIERTGGGGKQGGSTIGTKQLLIAHQNQQIEESREKTSQDPNYY